jgi:hypothetical protein
LTTASLQGSGDSWSISALHLNSAIWRLNRPSRLESSALLAGSNVSDSATGNLVLPTRRRHHHQESIFEGTESQLKMQGSPKQCPIRDNAHVRAAAYCGCASGKPHGRQHQSTLGSPLIRHSER